MGTPITEGVFCNAPIARLPCRGTFRQVVMLLVARKAAEFTLDASNKQKSAKLAV
jgi:hypothetical protein